MRIAGIMLVLLGIVIDVGLILSRQHHFLRILCLLFWWPGVTVLLAALRGVCVVLHWRYTRQLRPWEQDNDLDNGSRTGEHIVYNHGGQVDIEDDEGDTTPFKEKACPISGVVDAVVVTAKKHHHHSRKNTQASSVSLSSIGSLGADPLRKTSMQFFGPRNYDTTDEEAWRWQGVYEKKSIVEKIFCPRNGNGCVPVQNSSVRLVQDKVVLFAVIWGGVVSAAMTVGSLFIPSVGLF